ncbi:MAG: GDYXXLXY domain-containing protein [Candidatus Riflebacteria bacterium]|nr:GDYXXLXY domain-containing protein [Candidatus Riflebacteria bacterium]
MHKKIALVSLLVILGLINWSIYGKENHLAEGKIVYIDLAPVDPRSLMQGDYMALNFSISDEVRKALSEKENNSRESNNLATADGYAVIRLDQRNIGVYKCLYNDQILSNDEILMRYRVRNGTVKFATNAWFFQEGHGKHYQSAMYGQFRVDGNGELLLVAMYDKDLKKLEPN